jgi:hypothetical protein
VQPSLAPINTIKTKPWEQQRWGSLTPCRLGLGSPWLLLCSLRTSRLHTGR